MKEKRAHVEVFNRSVDEDECHDEDTRWHGWHHFHHHHDTGAPILGVMVLLAGIILFLNVIGQVPWSVWRVIWQFWPVILIFIGIQILSGFILFFLSLFVFGIIAIYSLQAVGVPFAFHWVLPQWVTFWLINIRRVMP
jgi:hypothetical protein